MTDLLFSPAAAAALELLVRATLLIAAAWAAAAALRASGASAAARHMAWLLGIAALLALPLLWWLAPALLLPILPETAMLSAPGDPLSAAASPALAGTAHSASLLPGGWLGLLALGYALGAAFLLLRIAVARRLLGRLWRESDSAPGRDWADLICALSLEMRLPRPVELRIAAGPFMPMTWGTLAPKVLLPAESLSWSAERRRLVLLHEFHVARRDSLSRSIASLACALYWFHPGAWFAARRLGMEQEHAADDRVLVAGGSAPAYARSLLHLATPPDARLRPAHAASMAGMYQLERRLLSIVNPAPRDRPTLVFQSSSALLASVATLILAAGVPVGAPSSPSDTPRAESDRIAKAAVPPLGAAETVGPRDVAAPPPEAVPAIAAAESRRPHDPVYARPTSDDLRQPPEPEIGPAPEQAGQPTSQDLPPILAGGEPFTLSPVVQTRSARLEQPPLPLASSELQVARPPATTVPRSLVERPPPTTRRLASWGRLSLTTSWNGQVQP